ncbi:MAG: hypothetical protein WA064_02085 [Candidatus Moraniibacteriota bacterium]
MKNFCGKYKNILSIGVFMLLALPACYFAWVFLLSGIKAKADRIQEKMIDNELTAQAVEKIPQMEKTDAEFEKSKDATETIFDADASVELIEYLEGLADETGNVITIQMLEKKKEVKVKTVPNLSEEEVEVIKENAPPKSLEDKLAYKNYIYMQINLIGDYAKLLNFVHKLENSSKYINILSLTLKKGEEDLATLAQKKSLRVGDIFQVAPAPEEGTPQVKKNVLKSNLVVAIYTK